MYHRFQNGQGITKDIICEKYRTVEDAMKWINHAIAENTYEIYQSITKKILNLWLGKMFCWH